MAPSAIYPETTSELTTAAINQILKETASSVVLNGSSSSLPELDASKLVFTPNTKPKIVPELDSPGVWSMASCTDHMITCSWSVTTGWSNPQLKPFGPFTISPLASVFHYATECFEGMKFYRGYDGRLRLFRPDRNARRMLKSATRIALPGFDPEELLKLIVKLVSVDGEKWLPKSRPGTCLYLRPTMIATAAALGVQKPKEALLYIVSCFIPDHSTPMMNPAFQARLAAGTVQPRKPGLRLLASKDDMVRAWPGGFGFAKVGANYGPSLMAQGEAVERGYDQILWLLGSQSEVTEAGASNFFVVWRTPEGKLQLVTAPLGDKIILEGVTRASVLDLAWERLTTPFLELEPLEVVERKFTMAEVVVAIEEDRLLEAFAVGTALFVSPVSAIHYRGTDLTIPMVNGNTGAYAGLLKKWLTNIMYGEEQHPWGYVVKETGVRT